MPNLSILPQCGWLSLKRPFLAQFITTRDMWERLGLKKTLEEVAKDAGAKIPYERALLAMVANRLCDPESKLGVWDRWLSTVYLPSCQDLKLRHMYGVMDLLHAHAEQVEKTVFFQTADLFNPEVDLIFYDTTTASFSVDREDRPTGFIPTRRCESSATAKRGFGRPKWWSL